MKFSKKQQEAILACDKDLLILAGAGSGKTRVMAYKIKHLIETLKTPTTSIASFTFTSKATEEMQNRLQNLLTHSQEKIFVGTFHAFGLLFLKEEMKKQGLKNKFSIYNSFDTEMLIRLLLTSQQIELKDEWIQKIIQNISLVKNQGLYPQLGDHLEIDLGEELNAEINFLTLFQSYCQHLSYYQAWDLDDLLYLPVKMLRSDAKILKRWSTRYLHLIIDEYQDTNRIQTLLIQLLKGEQTQIYAVGDDDQSIYRFRGADIQNILNFHRDFPNSQQLVLDYNYRSYPAIINGAKSLIKNNVNRYQKDIQNVRNSDQKIIQKEFENGVEEAQFIAQSIFSQYQINGYDYCQQAILCRTNHHMKSLELALRAHPENIPYKIIGGFSFFDLLEIRNLFAYLKVLNNTEDLISWNRVFQFPKNQIGEKSIDLLHRYRVQFKKTMQQTLEDIDHIGALKTTAQDQIKDLYQQILLLKQDIEIEQLGVGEIIDQVLHRFNFILELERLYPEKVLLKEKNLLEMKQKGEIFSKNNPKKGLYDFLIEMGMLRYYEDNHKNKVLLMTIHMAKGLEFRVVYLPQMEEDIFPHTHILEMNDPLALEEERRLMYVAMTRAQDLLYLSYAKSRNYRNQTKTRHPSRFLDEIDQQFKDTVDCIDEDEEKQLFANQLNQLFQK